MESYFENSDAEEDTSTNNLNPHEFYLKAKLDLNIEKFTINKDRHIAISEQIYNSFNNPNMVLLIIEDMSLGIIMTDHIANKFQYIKQTLEYRKENRLSANKIPTYLNLPIKIIINRYTSRFVGIQYFFRNITRLFSTFSSNTKFVLPLKLNFITNNFTTGHII